MLTVKAMSGSHRGEYIRQIFLTMLKEWNINAQHVLSCSAHTLQLIINDGLSSQREVGDILAKLKIIATHFNHSIIAQQRYCNCNSEGDWCPSAFHTPGCANQVELHTTLSPEDAGAKESNHSQFK